MSVLAPGETAYLRAGSYDGGSDDSVSWTRSGTPSAPITIRGYPGEESQVVLRSEVKLEGSYLRLQGVVVDHNTHMGNWDVGDVNVWLAGDHDVIQNNEIRNSNMSGVFTTGTNDQILRNFIHDNGTHAGLDHGVYMGGSNQFVAANVIVRNKAFGLQYWPSCNACTVASNTFVANGASGVIVGGPSSNALVINNISAFNSEDAIHVYALAGTGNVARNNLGYGNGGSNSCLLCAGLTTVGALTADPQFVDRNGDYHLQSGSPALGAAVPEYASPLAFGDVARPVGAGPDLGAHEQ